ncbi:hypothetical protein [Pantoea stewartii]|uniref:Uncharacterized protein n=1 Tax=Pantoea stewartii subsp. stewartii DC283 TaxID=660596 RepID=H3R9Q1_PANSE|nr:hypothetical protein [Pantoea stewartii]ARF51361.1 hypothetical protein DSJ_19930 [Pantoea stewartii subsp. stewartii DC283]EHU01914.1 hypothetical protein CKS_0382 [Pantoea stewartii subsp. stewartii DC283]KAB0549297.1 hypothetical protein F7Q90_19925 [Pantoea stewartii subsp. stewartii]
MSVRICIDVELNEAGFVITPKINVCPDNHTVSEMNIATSTVNYAVNLAAQFDRLFMKAKSVNGETSYV